MKANERQVAGTHYSATYQHWDFCEDCELGYMEGQITRYIIRWRKKNGIEDLEKALHYTEKLIEMSRLRGRTNRRFYLDGPTNTEVQQFTDKLFTNAQVEQRERVLIELVRDWRTTDDLVCLRSCIQDDIEYVRNTSDAIHS